jgi:ketosteroid isomerase-like protein
MIDDRWALFDLVARFDDAVNRRDVHEFAGLWAENAIWEIDDPMPMRVEGATQIVETWTHMLGGTKWLFRGSFAGGVEIDGDHATGRWPCVETGEFSDGKGYDNRAMYQDKYIRHGGRWRFLHRRYRYLWLSNEQLPGNAVELREQAH